MAQTETGVFLPAGVHLDDAPTVGPVSGPGTVVIDNRTGLSDALVEHAVEDYFVENASLAWGHQGTFQTYSNQGGGLLARGKFQTPANVFDEIRLARDIAEFDDDVRATLGTIIATAYEGGMQNFHEDERTVALFNEICRDMDLDHALKEVMREYLVAGQVTTVTAFTRSRFTFEPNGTGESIEERLAAPVLGILPAESVRVLDSDIFGSGGLGYIPTSDSHRKWLEEFFEPRTTAARRAALAREDPVSAALFIERVQLDERNPFLATGLWAYRLNPRMASRKTMPKGPGKPYPRPLLTANFALIEAKRLLNVMDYALLQGGANFIVVAKKGTDQHRASEAELQNLGQVVSRASRTGVIVGDHRLTFEIITPDLKELLNSEKRHLLGMKLASLLLRVPEFTTDGGTEAQKTWNELVTRVITSDRHDVQRHVESAVYAETAKRNVRVFTKGAAKIWHPKIILGGNKDFFDMVLKLADRGNISRKTLTEVAGFSWEAEVAQRQHEVESGQDETMVPAAVPFNSPDNGPADNAGGRPPGQGDGDRPDPAAPRRTRRGPNETVRAWWDEELADTVRVGETTYRMLEAYPGYDTTARMTPYEREALAADEEIAQRGGVTIVSLNPGYDCRDLRVVQLASGMRAILGHRRSDGALVTKALSFREPEFDAVSAEEFALRLGYERPEIEEETAVVPSPRKRRMLIRDESGNVIGSEEVDADA